MKERAIKQIFEGLDKKKNFFKDIESKIPECILEANEDDENEDDNLEVHAVED